MFGSWLRHHQPTVSSTITAASANSFSQTDFSHFAISADATLDNRPALCDALQFATKVALTDEQLILCAYERWGVACCNYLLGAYSFVIWDARSRHLFCARDHIGCTPFYYHLTPEQFVFGTRMEQVRAHVNPELDERFVRTRLEHKFFFDNERTFYTGVRKLPPGHTLTVTPDKAHVKRYWFPERAPECRLPNDDAYVSAFVELLQTVIEAQLPLESSVGVHLSGGLDSSLVTTVATHCLSQRNRAQPVAYCWLPPPTSEPLPHDQNLLEQARAQTGLRLRYQKLTGNDLKRGLERDLTLIPSALSLFHEQIVMRQAARDNINVILSGWGGDEAIAFNGRGYYAGLLRSRQWRRLWRESRAVSHRPLRHILSQGILPQYPWLQQARKRLVKRSRTPKHYLHPDFMRQVAPYPVPQLRHLNTRQTQLALLNYGHLSERMEAWASLGAEHDLVYRYPLLDKRIVEFALGLPPELFRRGLWNRWLMRKAAARMLPKAVAWNPSKDDPSRLEVLRSASKEAMAQIGQQLRTQTVSPSRAIYLDMPRLLADLSPDALAKGKGRLEKLWQALLFLDF